MAYCLHPTCTLSSIVISACVSCCTVRVDTVQFVAAYQRVLAGQHLAVRVPFNTLIKARMCMCACMTMPVYIYGCVSCWDAYTVPRVIKLNGVSTVMLN